MVDFKKLLTPFVGTVTLLFGIFNGFLVYIAPPDESGLAFAVGILPFLVLIVLILIAAASRPTWTAKSRHWWIASGVALFLLAVPAVFVYPLALARYTFVPAGTTTRHVCASPDYLTPQARTYVLDHPDESAPARLLRNFPDERSVWEERGLEVAQEKLLGAYTWLVLALCSSILCLLNAFTDGTMTSLGGRRKRPAAAPEVPAHGSKEAAARAEVSPPSGN